MSALFSPEQVAEIRRIVLSVDERKRKLAERDELLVTLSTPRSALVNALAAEEKALKDGSVAGALHYKQITGLQYAVIFARQAIEKFDASTVRLEELNEELAESVS
jgi:hypothetical protein